MKKPLLLIVLASLAAAAFSQSYAGFKQAGNAVNTTTDMELTAGHPVLPIGTKVVVTRPDNGKHVTVTINKRIPNTSSYMLQISRGTAAALDIPPSGMAFVQLEVPKAPPVAKKPEPKKPEEPKPEEKKPEEKKPEEPKAEEPKPEEKKPEEPKAEEPKPEEPKPEEPKAEEPKKDEEPKTPALAASPSASVSPTTSVAPAININNSNTSSNNVNIGDITSGLLASAAKPAAPAEKPAPAAPVPQPAPAAPAAAAPVPQPAAPAAPVPQPAPQPKPAPVAEKPPAAPNWGAPAYEPEIRPEPPTKAVGIPFPLAATPPKKAEPPAEPPARRAEPARQSEPRHAEPARHPEPPPVHTPPAYDAGRSAEIHPRVPEPYTGLYKVQVGAYRDSANAKQSFDRLTVAGFRPSADQYEGLSRVFLENIAAEDIPGLAVSLGRLGFTAIYVRK